MIKLTVHKQPFGATSQRLLNTVTREMVPAYNVLGPFGEPPLICSVFLISDLLKRSANEIQEKAKKGMMMVSFFRIEVLLEENTVQVYQVNNEKKDVLFFEIKIIN